MYPGLFEFGAEEYRAAVRQATQLLERYQREVYAEEDPEFPMLLWSIDRSKYFDYLLPFGRVRFTEFGIESGFFGNVDDFNPPPLSFKIIPAPNGTVWELSDIAGWSVQAHPSHVDWYCCSGPPNIFEDGPLAGLRECSVIKGVMLQLKVDDSQGIDGWHSEWHDYRVSTEPEYIRSLIVSLANGVAKNTRVNVYLICT